MINYVQCLCVCCGTCIHTCPEGAAQFRHELSMGGFFKIISKQTLISVELIACDNCGTFFAPKPQLDKLEFSSPRSVRPET